MGGWDKKLLESAAGVADSSGWIQISVGPKMLIRSALLTADWQIQRPIEKERGKEEDARVSKILLSSTFDISALLGDNRNVLESHDKGGEKRIEGERGNKISVKNR